MLSLCAAGRPWWSTVGLIDPSALFIDLELLCRSKGWKRVILVGWSMGARLALEFASRHPRMVETLILLAIRKNWPQHEIAAIRRELLADPAAFLRSFYRKCLLGRKEALRHFINQYQERELLHVDLDILEAGLSLLQEPLPPVIDRLGLSGFPPAKIWLVHGENDIIAPCPERLLLDGATQLILKNEGHSLFLMPSVRDFSFLAQSGPSEPQQ